VQGRPARLDIALIHMRTIVQQVVRLQQQHVAATTTAAGPAAAADHKCQQDHGM
jgi:hypothetical protein